MDHWQDPSNSVGFMPTSCCSLKGEKIQKDEPSLQETIKHRPSQMSRNLGAEQKSESADCTIMCASTQDSQISKGETVCGTNRFDGWLDQTSRNATPNANMQMFGAICNRIFADCLHVMCSTANPLETQN